MILKNDQIKNNFFFLIVMTKNTNILIKQNQMLKYTIDRFQ